MDATEHHPAVISGTAPGGSVSEYVIYASAVPIVLGMCVFWGMSWTSVGDRVPAWVTWLMACSAGLSAIGLFLGVVAALLESPAELDGHAQPSSAVYEAYALVAWHRRSKTISWFILVGFFLLPPFLWAACVICLTGDVYYKRANADGTLSRWSAGNKVAAVFILLLQLSAIASGLGLFGS